MFTSKIWCFYRYIQERMNAILLLCRTLSWALLFSRQGVIVNFGLHALFSAGSKRITKKYKYGEVTSQQSVVTIQSPFCGHNME